MPRTSKSPATGPDPIVTKAWVNLMRAQRIVLSAIEQDLREAGMPPLAWYDVLLELSRAAGGRLRPYDIEDRILLAQYNLSRLIDRLEREGLVIKETFGEDRRGRWVKITKEGLKTREEMWIVYGRAIQAHVGRNLGGDNVGHLSNLLERLVANH